MARLFSRRGLAAIAGILWLSTLLVPILLENTKVSAEPSTRPRLVWLNAQTIRDENANINYLDDDVAGIEGTRLYFKTGNPHSCPNNQPAMKLHGHDIKFRDTLDVQGWSNNGTKPGTTANWWYVEESTSITDSHCTSNLQLPNSDNRKVINLPISNQEYATATYSWINKNTISHFNMYVGQGDTLDANNAPTANFEYDPLQKKFIEKTASRCKSYITADPANPNRGQLVLAQATENGCGARSAISILLAFPNNAKTDTAAPGQAAGDTNKESVSCETSGSPLSWVFCPVINMLATGGDFLFDHLIQPLLRTNPLDFTNDSPIFKIWSSFRLIGNLVLVIALFVIVFSQATGLNLDAYAVKKIMPRLLVAAILINLSIYLVSVALDITNVIGEGLRNLIVAPLGDQAKIEPGNLFGGLGLASLTVTGLGALLLAYPGIAAGSAALALGPFVTILQGLFMLVLLPAFLGLLGVLVTLIIRQGIIVFLVIISPIAFALYCLPNTEQYFKKWWDLLIKTLAVYPIVILVFAISNVLAAVMSASKPTGAAFEGLLYDIVAVVIRIIPLFLIPFAFKFAGGMVATLYGALSGYSKRGMEALKGNPNDPYSWRRRMTDKWRGDRTRARTSFVRNNAATYGANKATVKDPETGEERYKYRRGTRTVRGLLGNAMNTGNLKAAESILNKQAREIQESVTGDGDDTDVNNRSAVFGQMYDKETGKALMKKDKNGNLVPDHDWQTLDGNRVAGGRAAVRKAQSLYPGLGGLQGSISYRLKKTSTATDAEIFRRNAGLLASQHGVHPDEITSLLTGVGYQRQNERLEFKHSKYDETGPLEQEEYGATPGSIGYLSVKNKKMDGKNISFVDEIHNKKGTWAMSQQADTTVDHLTKIQDHWQEQYLAAKSTATDATKSAEERATASQQQALLRERLKKVYEIGSELSPQATRTTDTPLDDKGMPVAGYGGVQGAPAAVQNAVARLKQGRESSSAFTEIVNSYHIPPGPGGGGTPPPRDDGYGSPGAYL